MLINFSKKQYLNFLSEIYEFCDELKIVEEDDNWFIKKISPYANHHIWTRKFPGYDRSCNLKVLVFNMSDVIINILKEHPSFFCFGDDYNDEGIDMAFYRKGELVFHVLNHEEMCYLEDKYKANFRFI